MPYAGVDDADTAQLDSCVEKVVAQGYEKSSAIAICRASMNLSESQKVIRWVEPFAFQPGKPFRVLPIGKFQRNGRELDLTPERLKQMAENYAAGRPRWPIPIYMGHPTAEQPDPPKAGEVRRLFMGDDGLYADPQYTDKGRATVESGEYTLNSPGILWKLNGSQYTDEQGAEHDNVIDHVALTNRPYFSGNVVTFSAAPLPETMAMDAGQKTKHILATAMGHLKSLMQSLVAAQEAETAEETPAGEMQMATQTTKPEILSTSATIAPVISPLPVSVEDNHKEQKTMADEIKAPAVETFTVSAEEFAALKAEAAKTKTLEADLGALQKQAETFAADLQKERDTHRREQWRARAETFTALPGKADELADKLMALEKKDAELAVYFADKLTAADKLIAEGNLFGELSTRRPAKSVESFSEYINVVLKEQFGGDPAKYADAMHKAGQLRPDLMREYQNAPSVH